MSRDKQTIQIKRKEQTHKYDLKKNRISFKEFQQCYEQHVQTQKQKKKFQQQSLSKLSLKNSKPLQEISDKENEPYQSNQMKAFFNNNQQSNQPQFQQSTNVYPITFDRTINIKSCFTSPKASSMNFMKSINLASNKAKQIIKNKENSSNTKNNEKFFESKRRTNVAINLNVKPSSQPNEVKKLSKDENSQKDVVNLQSNHMSKNSSLSKINSIDLYQGSLTSIGSQKALNEVNPLSFQPISILLQQINYLSTQLQFLNQFFKQISPQQQPQTFHNNSNMTYKTKLLSQIKIKLKKYEQNSVNSKNPLKQLFSNLIQLLSNYENDLNKLSSIPDKTQSKNKALEIVIDQNSHEIDYENRFKRQDSKRKTVKLSKSRRTNQETLHTQSIVQPFQSSELSFLNTSKITDISRPSSQNKQKSNYYNEIENIINSKILHLSVDKSQSIKPNVVKNTTQSQSKTKVLIKGSSKIANNPSVKGIATKGLQNKNDILLQQPETKNKVKSVTKTINLNINSKPEVIQQVLQVQKAKSITMKDILQKNKQKNLVQQTDNFNEIKIHSKQLPKHTFFADARQSIGSHNDSIFQLEYLENYSSHNHNFPVHHQETINPWSKTNVQIGSNINWKQNKYSNKLFM